MREPRWPLWVWGLQLVPAAFLVFFAIWRQSVKDRIQADEVITFLSLAIGVAWVLGILATLVFSRSRQWLIARRRNWSLSALSILMCLALMDVALTYFGVVPTIEAQRALSIGYTHGLYTKHRLVVKDILLENGDPIHINRRGFRGPEIAPKKRPGQVRILFLGGSQVFDYRGGDWPGTVGEKFRRAEHDVEVINAGVPGHVTFDSLGKVLTDIWTLEPDIIFLCQAWNDIKYFSWLSPENPYRGLPPRTAISWHKDWRLYPGGLDRVLSLSSIYRQFRWGIGQLLYFEEGGRKTNADQSGKVHNAITQWGPNQYRLNLTLIADLSEAIGAELVICKQAHLAVVGGTGEDQEAARNYGIRNTRLSHAALMQAFELTYSIIDKVAEDRGIKISNMNEGLSGREDYFDDGIHFSPTGSRAAANLVFETLSPLVVRSSSNN